MKKPATLLLFLVLAVSSHPLLAELRLPNIFGDAMVLQRNKPVKVWGWAKAGAEVKVAIAGQETTTKAGAAGKWAATLPAMKASSRGTKLTVQSGTQRLELADVLIGELWICGGQSNMEWSMRASRDADIEISSADYPAIRYARLPHIARPEPQEDFPLEDRKNPQGSWRRCDGKDVENCTAVGYYFARRLHRRLRVPVGIIDTSWGGTMAQHWVSTGTLRPFPEMKPYFDDFESKMKAWSEGGGEEGARKRLAADTAAWEKKRAEARAKGEREPRRPNSNAYTDPSGKRQPGGMYNGMILPLAKLSIRGVLFYQGENNSFSVSWKPFHRTFPAVISDWRKAFGDPQLPFGIIQIAGWSTRRSMTYDMNHHTNVIREIQLNTWKRTPGTGLIATYDTNSNGSIHPGRKLPVGGRSARWALAEVYKAESSRPGSPIEWRGPVYTGFEINGNKLVASFEDGTSRGLRLDQDVDVGFVIAGKDQVFHNARARISKGNLVEIWSDKVPEPAAARYAWSNLPHGGLMNARELPAYPFRTDTWPLTPHQSTGSYQVK